MNLQHIKKSYCSEFKAFKRYHAEFLDINEMSVKRKKCKATVILMNMAFLSLLLYCFAQTFFCVLFVADFILIICLSKHFRVYDYYLYVKYKDNTFSEFRLLKKELVEAMEYVKKHDS
jgi:hypothetical protein